jgi:predicted HTH domain antitoxin
MKSTDREIRIKVPEDILLSASFNETRFVTEMRETLAFKLFSQGRLSGGKAAKLAGMSRVQFLLEAGKHNIDWLPFGQDELRRELS